MQTSSRGFEFKLFFSSRRELLRPNTTVVVKFTRTDRQPLVYIYDQGQRPRTESANMLTVYKTGEDLDAYYS